MLKMGLANYVGSGRACPQEYLMVLHFGNDLYVPKWEGGESSMSLPKEVLLYGNAFNLPAPPFVMITYRLNTQAKENIIRSDYT